MCRPSAGGECGSVVAAGLPKVAAIQMTSGRDVAALAYAVAAAQWGDHDSGRKTYGHSMIVDPWGVIIAERDAGAGVIMADLDMMALQHRRQL